MTPRDFLEAWEALGDRGFFDGEPDYDRAIRAFRAEVEAGDPEEYENMHWVGGMYLRVLHGRRPVTERGWCEAAQWYLRNLPLHRAELYEVNLKLFVGDGDARTARHPDVTAVFERLQRLRARHPEYE
jgi:hypothetical protein